MLVLFLLVVAGIIAQWFWGVGWTYLADQARPIDFGTWTAFLVRLGLSVITALLTFVPTYNKIGQSTSESWVPYLLAFQNGFFWNAAYDAIVQQFDPS